MILALKLSKKYSGYFDCRSGLAFDTQLTLEMNNQQIKQNADLGESKGKDLSTHKTLDTHFDQYWVSEKHTPTHRDNFTEGSLRV